MNELEEVTARPIPDNGPVVAAIAVGITIVFAIGVGVLLTVLMH